jgi:hypothetical protein
LGSIRTAGLKRAGEKMGTTERSYAPRHRKVFWFLAIHRPEKLYWKRGWRL